MSPYPLLLSTCSRKQETERKHDAESDVRIEMLDTEAIRMGLLGGLLPEVGDDRKEGRLEAGQE